MFDDYLDRLGVERAVPSVDHLFRLHRAHVERVPYETTWMFLEETRGVDQRASIDLIARQGRGGYCFHLNGALAALLEHLGYDVTLHLGGVHHPEPDTADLANHLVLIVEHLTTGYDTDIDERVARSECRAPERKVFLVRDHLGGVVDLHH